MKLAPTQDWMILKLVERPLTVTLIETPKEDYAGFEVLAIGPWEYVPTGGGGSWTYEQHNIKVGEVVVIEGLNAPVFEFEGERYYGARARNVCFKKV